MNDIQQSLGAEVPIRFVVQDNGSEKVLMFSPLTFRIKGEFSDYAKSRAKAELFEMRTMLDGDSFANAVAKFARDAGTGAYKWGKMATIELANTDDGIVYFIWLLLKKYQPKLEVEELQSLMSRHITEFKDQVGEIMEIDAKNLGNPAKT